MKEQAEEIFLIIGATGNQGGAVIQQLIKQQTKAKFKIRALVRNPESETAKSLENNGVKLIKGSMEDKNAMNLALESVTRMFFHTTHNTFKGESWKAESERGLAAVEEIAKSHSLKQIIYSTLPIIEGYHEALGKSSIEQEMRKRNLPLVTVLAPFYLENFINIWPPIRKWFGYLGPLQWGWLPSEKDLRMPHGSVEDFGAVVANILLLPTENYLNRKITVVSEDIMLSNVLKKLSVGINKKIHWKPMSLRVFRNLAFPKEALDGLEFYANKLSDSKKVEAGFLQTDAVGPLSLAEAKKESHQLYPEILSIEDWASKNKDIIGKGSIKTIIISILIFWAKVKSVFKIKNRRVE